MLPTRFPSYEKFFSKFFLLWLRTRWNLEMIPKIKKYLSCHRFLLRCVYYHFRAFSSQEQKEICHHIQNTIFCITIWFNIWIFIFLSFTSLWAFFKVFLHFLKLMWPEFHLDALIIWLGVRTTLQIIIFLIRDKMWMAPHLDLCVLLSSTPLICLHSNRPW